MRKVVAKRLAGAVVQVLMVTLLAWLLFYVIARFTGASPAQRIAGKNATAAQIAQVSAMLGLSKPYWQQYLIFLGHLATGNFGFSYVQQRPVSEILWPATLATASLVFGAAVLWLLIAAPIGGYGGLRPRSIGDVTGRAVAILGMSIPVFWLAPMVSYFLGYQPTQGELAGLHILPVGTSIFPIDDKANGGLPTGGNAALITSRDQKKQKAAWEFLKFVTGPEAQKIVVETTGYLPTNKRAPGPEFLGPYYDQNPNFRTVSLQMDRSVPWQGYPGGNSVRIWRAQREIINSVMRGDIDAKAGYDKLVKETASLMQSQ